jgi:hypothetical protein
VRAPLLYWRQRPSREERAISEEQNQPTTTTPTVTTGDRWGDPISAERQAELQGTLNAWDAPDADRKGTFDQVPLLTNTPTD